jgi:hypothetical protein
MANIEPYFGMRKLFSMFLTRRASAAQMGGSETSGDMLRLAQCAAAMIGLQSSTARAIREQNAYESLEEQY